MEDYLYMKILERLCKRGLNQDTDISDIVNCDYFTRPPREMIEDQTDEQYSDLEYIIELGSHPKSEQIGDFLKKMRENEHITYENKSSTLSLPKNPHGEYIYPSWEKMPVKFSAQITKQGLDYYYNRVLQTSTLVLQKNQKWQTRLAALTVVVSVFAIWLSYVSYIKPEPKMSELNKNIQLVSKELEGLKTILNQQKDYPIPPAKKSHKQ